MNSSYSINLALMPTTFDFWHVCLAVSVLVLMILLIIVLFMMASGSAGNREKLIKQFQEQNQALTPPLKTTAPEIKVVEKIVEVEKIVPGPSPEPVVLKESTPDAALQLLSLLQKEARFVDFIKEDVTAYNDADVGIAARVVHEGCKKVIDEYFKLIPIRNEQEGDKIPLPKGFDAAAVRITGNIIGEPPFTGALIHKGWQATEIRLPKLTKEHNAKIIAPAEVEL
jgi:hypothetical protein